MGPEVAIKDQGGIAKFLNYCLYEMLKMQRFDDDDDYNDDGGNVGQLLMEIFGRAV